MRICQLKQLRKIRKPHELHLLDPAVRVLLAEHCIRANHRLSDWLDARAKRFPYYFFPKRMLAARSSVLDRSSFWIVVMDETLIEECGWSMMGFLPHVEWMKRSAGIIVYWSSRRKAKSISLV
ncbi:MAG: hypothetical protein HC888_04015 [Candidatus Competibacteraceae bacterium]|nr:hypothetical protein [Candidatus Competibacteraceae bacterium]